MDLNIDAHLIRSSGQTVQAVTPSQVDDSRTSVVETASSPVVADPEEAGIGREVAQTKTRPNRSRPASNGISLGINVKSFGATGNARKIVDAVALNGTNTVSHAKASFTAADIGKMVWGTNSAGANVLTPRTVTSFRSANEITVSGPPLGGWRGLSLVIGTDDTAAIHAAVKAVEAQPNRGSIIIPSGGYITSSTPFVFTADPVAFTLPSIIGEGSASTSFFPAPNSTFTSNCIFNYDSLNGRKHVQGITVDGSNGTFVAKNVMYISTSANGNTLQDVRVVSFTSVFAALTISSARTTLQHCHIETIGGGRGIFCNGGLFFIDSYSGNCGYRSIDVANGGLTVVRGILDESNAGTVYLTNSTASFTDALVYAGASYTAVEADGRSVVRALQSNFIPFSSNQNCTGLKLHSGAKAYLNQCIMNGSGTGHGLHNEGTVYDGGNNMAGTKTGAGKITRLSL